MSLSRDSRDLIVSKESFAARRALSTWKRREHDEIERFADSIAERAFNVTIGYTGPCLLQSDSGAGVRPRPPSLQ